MGLLQRFKDSIKQQHLFSPKDKLFLAVSGGVDSVVMCTLCKQAGYDFTIAHCNFQLRGLESERDEDFVKKLGEKYKVRVLVKRFETEVYADKHKISIQEAARALRYDWFEELVNSELLIVNSQLAIENTNSATGKIHHSPLTIHLLTAHHKDDNIETLLMNFFRGTGLHGLTGIPQSYSHIKRPMLPFSKDELVEYARENNLQFMEDSSNLSSKYTRNFFRNEIIPAISNVYPQVKENLADNIARFKEIEKLYRLTVGDLKKKWCKVKGAEVHIPVLQLVKYNNRALIYEIIREYGFHEKQVDEVIKLAGSESGRYIESPVLQYRIIKHRHWFIISPSKSVAASNIIIEAKEESVGFEKGLLHFEKTTKVQASNSNHVATLDAKEITWPLLLRRWKTGDYFYPLGMSKKKKLSRFFIDQKLSKTEKENAWVIESNKRIIWVIGHRIDNRFKLTENTRDVLKITLAV
jgi:tRNA(Ile)-lysidine synthase